jgi:hypothetical protein
VTGTRGNWVAFMESGIPFVVLVYSAIVCFSLFTLSLGPVRVVYALSGFSWGGLLSVFVFDSWGTAFGLLGMIEFYGIVVLATERSRRLEMSLFLLFSTIVMAISAELLWDKFFDTTTFLGRMIIAAGASTVAISGEGAVIVISIVGLANLIKSRLWRRERGLSVGWIALYSAVIVPNLLFLFYLEPIYVPTTLYNWEAHAIAFVLGVVATALYLAIRRVPVGVFGNPAEH